MSRIGLLSVVIPVYNESKNISRCYLKIDKLLSQHKIKHEIIFVDDGSSDDTWELILKQKNAFGVSFSRNFGKESAIIAGLANMSGDCAVVIDCDLQQPPEKIIEMYEKWQEGYDIIEGKKKSRGKEGVTKKIGARIFYKIMNKAMNVDMTDASDFKLLDRAAVKTLLNMPEKNAFFRALSSWIGFKSTTVMYSVRERKEGESKWSIKKLISYAISNITSFTTMPMQVITFLGMTILFIAIILTIIAIKDYINGVALGGFTTVIILICFIGSSIMISLGIIGYYLSKIYEQVQDRPKYIITERKLNNDKKTS